MTRSSGEICDEQSKQTERKEEGQGGELEELGEGRDDTTRLGRA